MSHHAIDGLIERLYGMPQVGADWRPFLTALGDVFRAHVVAFHSHDILNQQGVIETGIGLVDGMMSKFKALSHEHPWYIHGGEKLFRDGMADDEGLLPEHVFYGTRFYGEVLVPAYVEHGMAVMLRHSGPTQMTLISINRGRKEGYYGENERALASQLLPHLRAAYFLQQQLSWMETLARTFRSALDRLNDGVVILDRQGVIQFANTAAERFEAESIYHRCQDGRLRLPTAAQSKLLSAYIRTSEVDQQPFSLRVLDAKGHWIATLKGCSVESVANQHWGESEAGVMLFFSTSQTLVVANHGAHWQSLWGFTRAETDLAKKLVDGRSLAEAADASGVSINTVRTQLRALLSKTGARGQSELVRTLLLSR